MCTKLQASKPCCERIKFKTKLFKIVNEDAEKCVNPSESERKHWCEFPCLHPVVTFQRTVHGASTARDSLYVKAAMSRPVPICCLPLGSSVSCSPSCHELTAHNQAEQALMKVLILLEGHAYPRAAVKRPKESSLSQVYVIGNSM